jgi:glutamine synthetase
MTPEEIVMICTSDLAGQVRGKGFPACDHAERMKKGIGWTPTNSMITALGAIAPSPWGPFGDLVLRPAAETEVRVQLDESGAATHFVMADICHLDGRDWEVCPRSFLRRVIQALADRHGLGVKAAFEHEFAYSGVEEKPNASYTLDAFRRQGVFAETFLGALREAGVKLDTFMPEYGPQQYEITVGPDEGVKAADTAIVVRELARAAARHLGHSVSLSPILRPSAVGNGVHIHFSLFDLKTGEPVNHDSSHPHGLSETAARFLGGMLAKMNTYLAFTASSPISYLRLTPNRWSAAYNNLGYRDREAGIRICPVFDASKIHHQFHFEYRAADASASPYLALGAIVAAGLWGLDTGVDGAKVFEGAPQNFDQGHLDADGIRRLPLTLTEALDRLAADTDLEPIIGGELKQAFITHKRFEIGLTAELTDEERCDRYREAY